MVHLESITKENYRECMGLKVAENQSHHVAPSAKSLAEAYVYYDTAHPWAIYSDETMIGFLLLRDLDNLQCYYLAQFMVDERYQGQGFGKRAVELLLEMLRREKRYSKVDLCYVEGNAAAETLFTGLGFRPTGEVEADEIIMELEL